MNWRRSIGSERRRSSSRSRRAVGFEGASIFSPPGFNLTFFWQVKKVRLFMGGDDNVYWLIWFPAPESILSEASDERL